MTLKRWLVVLAGALAYMGLGRISQLNFVGAETVCYFWLPSGPGQPMDQWPVKLGEFGPGRFIIAVAQPQHQTWSSGRFYSHHLLSTPAEHADLHPLFLGSGFASTVAVCFAR